jgi:hypothetical protein
VTAGSYDDETLAKQLADECTADQFVNHPVADIISLSTGGS